jgi:general secretion pathway protein J
MRFDRSKFQSTSQRGLTLVELLVAISVMAFVAVLGWRGLDSITRARASLNQDLEQTRGLQLAFAQMQTDCMIVVNAAEIDGRAPLQVDPARITLIRRTQPEAQPGALQLVTYRLRDGLLTREESPPTRDLTRLEQYVQLVQSPAPSSIPQSSTLQSSIPQSSTQPLSQSRVRLQSGVQAMDLRVWADDGRGWRSLNNLDSNMPTSRSALMNPQAGTTATQIIWSGLEVALRLPGRQASLTKIFLLGSV